jgi:hypothetical protein
MIECCPDERKMPPPTERAVSRVFFASWKEAGLQGAGAETGDGEVVDPALTSAGIVEGPRERDDTGVMRSALEEVLVDGIAESSSTMVIGMRLRLGGSGREDPARGAMATSIGCYS